MAGFLIKHFYRVQFCDIISGMRKRNICILSILSCLYAGGSFAGWQYPGAYVGDGWYADDGSRFIISARGGAAFGMGTIKNEIGASSVQYVVDETDTTIIPIGACLISEGGCSDWYDVGFADLGALPANKDFESFSFAAGASIGWTIPNRPQWRIEAGWDHISKSEYNSSPMFQGVVALDGIDADITSGSVRSQITTDIISVMAFYDFFEGLQKPSRTVIPYIGFGIGYADSKTVLDLSDPYGDIAFQFEFQDYGDIVEINGYRMVERFYRSERRTSNVAGMLSAGISYGITEQMFFDFGLRMAYLPRVTWGLTNADDTRHREYFSAQNMIYINALMGIRFEF